MAKIASNVWKFYEKVNFILFWKKNAGDFKGIMPMTL